MAPLNKRKQFVLWVAAALTATAGLVAVVTAERRPSAPRHALYVIGIPEKGAALFFGDKHCSICHAVNGSGGRIAPDLGRIRLGKPAMAWLAAGLWNHSPGMLRQMGGAKPPDLNQEEMAHVLAYLYQAGTADPAGDATAGERVFAAKGCGHCHSAQPSGGHPGPDLVHAAASQDAAAWMRSMWNHAHSMLEPITRELGKWPQFQGQEMNDLIAYVSKGAPAGHHPGEDAAALRGATERGWQAFQAKCIQCHSVGGKGGRSGPELGPDRALPNRTAEFAAVLWNHAPAMLEQGRASATPIPTMEGSEIQDILQFLVSLRYYEPSGSSFLGERVFVERGCARCHGPKAGGTREAPPLRAGGSDAFTTVSLASALWRHGPAMKARSEQLGIGWPTLEAGDIGDLISFLNDAERQ